MGTGKVLVVRFRDQLIFSQVSKKAKQADAVEYVLLAVGQKSQQFVGGALFDPDLLVAHAAAETETAVGRHLQEHDLVVPGEHVGAVVRVGQPSAATPDPRSMGIFPRFEELLE